MLVDGKVLFIAGVGPGMGRALALLAAREGASVVLGARNLDFLAEVEAEVIRKGGQALPVSLDVTEPSACAGAVERALTRFGRIDSLINIAYRYGTPAFAMDADPADWRATMDVICFGALNMTKAAVPALRESRGSIVNVSTITTRRPYLVGDGGYAVAKAALNGLTRHLAVELGRDGIRVNTALMGWLWGAPVQEHVCAAAKARGVSEDIIIAEIVERIPLNVIPPESECAKSVLFLASDYASMVTGASLDINGGEYVPA